MHARAARRDLEGRARQQTRSAPCPQPRLLMAGVGARSLEGEKCSGKVLHPGALTVP